MIERADDMAKKIVFLTGTRADFGKIKSWLSILQTTKEFETHIFVTGMHLNSRYGETVHEIEKSGFSNIYTFANHGAGSELDRVVSRTIQGFSDFVKSVKPDLIVVHGDRAEALSGALVGAFNNILVAHIEGGEISGSIDEHIRHAVSKLSHLHFAANQGAKRRLIQMGEREETIFLTGSPDIDIMNSSTLPSWTEAKEHYSIPFDDFALLIFHPVTTEADAVRSNTEQLVDAAIESGMNYVVIYPNNDPGADAILEVYREKLPGNPRFVIYPSLRFEHFLTVLKNARFIVGNSSAGIREAPYYGVPTINIGNRQNGRISVGAVESIKHCDHAKNSVLGSLKEVGGVRVHFQSAQPFGGGGSDRQFMNILLNKNIWQIKPQKQFSDIDF